MDMDVMIISGEMYSTDSYMTYVQALEKGALYPMKSAKVDPYTVTGFQPVYDTLRSMVEVSNLLVGEKAPIRIQITVGLTRLRECDLSEAESVLMEHELILLRQRVVC